MGELDPKTVEAIAAFIEACPKQITRDATGKRLAAEVRALLPQPKAPTLRDAALALVCAFDYGEACYDISALRSALAAEQTPDPRDARIEELEADRRIAFDALESQLTAERATSAQLRTLVASLDPTGAKGVALSQLANAVEKLRDLSEKLSTPQPKGDDDAKED